MPTEEIDEFLLRRDFFDELIEVCFRGHIARADPAKVISASDLGWPTGRAYGMMVPASFGVWVLAAFSRTSIRRPVM